MIGRFALSLVALSMLSPLAWADGYETPVPMPPSPMPAALPAMPGPASPNLARVYVYREQNYQNLEYTAVWFNGAHVGDSAAGTYFYRDVRPGTYAVTVRSESPARDQFATVTVPAGSTTYIKVSGMYDYAAAVPAVRTRHMQFDGVMSPGTPNVFTDAVVPPTVALPEIAKLEPAS